MFSSLWVLHLGLLLALGNSHASAACSKPTGTSKPNFIYIMTDDQDLRMNSIDYQPALQKHFVNEGTFFSRHFCTVSQCCPSRVSLLTGKAAHNTNVTALSLPYGGYLGFVQNGWNERYLPVYLQGAGYNTYYTGKLMNSHSTTTYNNPFPAGWNGSDFLIDPGTYIYYNCTTQRNRDPPVSNPGVYSTDLIASKALGFLDEAAVAGGPFFLGITPIGPHGETIPTDTGVGFYAPVPADRHKDLFPDVKVPRTPNFNPNVSSSASWIKTLAKQNETFVAYNDDFYRKRLQALQAVDDLIEGVFTWLHAHPDIMDNTYIIYTSDNGFHLGQHRLPPGKTCNIEEDINVPFFVRGPDVPKGKVVDYATSHTDILPTIFELAGIPLLDDFDGEPIPFIPSIKSQGKSEQVNIEFWGDGGLEGKYSEFTVKGANNTYKTVRIVGKEYNLMYTVWCTNEHELYDMTVDPYQMNNLYDSLATIAGWEIKKLTHRIDALLMTLKSCSGKVCTRPWDTLHPVGNVKNIKDAMASKYDQFYTSQPKVSFTACSAGNILAYEGVLYPGIFGTNASDEKAQYVREATWEDWT
ncbi:arylsulfatase precursor [Thozetella sp. PMI_491]|nr:arylsulfatase precursor [Thozetella sp. PMI_491]